MICCLTATINGEKRMRQMRGAKFATANLPRRGQTGLIRSAPDGVNGFMLEQKQLIFHRGVVPLSGDDFFLQRQRLREFHSTEPAYAKKRCGVHIWMPPAIPSRAASCARRCVRAIASASAASGSGVSV